MVKRLLMVFAGVLLLFGALTAESCSEPKQSPQSMLNATVLANFTIPSASNRSLSLTFYQTGTYVVTFTMGSKDPDASNSKYLPKSLTCEITTPKQVVSITQRDWPTYFDITILRLSDGASDTLSNVYSW